MRRLSLSGRLLALLIVAMTCGVLLPCSVLAQGPAVAEVAEAIRQKGLQWTPKVYERPFALGLVEEGASEAEKGPQAELEESKLSKLPPSLDWRDHGGSYVSPVKDQRECGSSWAYAAVGALESLYAITDKAPGAFPDLSEKALVGEGCSGGALQKAAQLLQEQGAYEEGKGAPSETKGYPLGSYQPVGRSVGALKLALQGGPLAVGLTAYEDLFSYGAGVYEHAWGERVGGQAVLLVGYVDTPDSYGGGYFIAKNSWGVDWGEEGYLRLGYSQVINEVGLGQGAYRYSRQLLAADAYEPDNVAQDSKPIGFGNWQSHSIDPTGDHDWVGFTLSVPGTVTIETWGTGGYDTVMWLYDSSLMVIAQDDDGGEGFYSRIVQHLWPGTYYAAVWAYGDNSLIPQYWLHLSGWRDPMQWIAGFGYNAGGWTSQDKYPRMLADVTGDGKADVVGFGNGGVYVSRSTGTGFLAPTLWIAKFGYAQGGWSSQDKFPRCVGDVDGDFRADIVGFGNTGTFVSLSNGVNGFGPAQKWLNLLGYSQGWTSQDKYPRCLANVDRWAGKDVVGFASDGTYVAISTGASFGTPTRWVAAYGVGAGGWTSQNLYPRMVADTEPPQVGLAVVGFGAAGTYVSVSPTETFFWSPVLAMTKFGLNAAAGGWSSQDKYPRFTADVTGDGQDDIVGFANGGVYVSVNLN